MSIRKTKKIFKRMLCSVNKNMCLKDYAFFCSKEFKSKVTTYKGYPVYYINVIKKGFIYLSPNDLYV